MKVLMFKVDYLDINGDNQSLQEDGEWGYKIIKTGRSSTIYGILDAGTLLYILKSTFHFSREFSSI